MNKTLRQKLADILRKQGGMTAKDLSKRLTLTEKDVCEHLSHLSRSLAAQGETLSVDPAVCQACGYTFSDRTRLTTPGRCPACKAQRIDPPVFWVE